MRCPWRRYNITEVFLAYVLAFAARMIGSAAGVTFAHDVTSDMSTINPTSDSLPTKTPGEENLCCSGVLGYASDNVSLNFPCQNRPCCNSSETVAVVSIDFALGFRFQCMPRNTIQPLCYHTGAEVRTTNQDPDFIPRACCEGLKFKVVLNQWYAAMVVKCVEKEEEKEGESS